MSEHLKKSDDAAYNYVLKDVNEFIDEIKSIEEKNNLSLFEEFFESSSDYAKMLINTKNADENKEIVEEIEDRISGLKDRIEKMSDKEKNIKMQMRHKRLLEKFFIIIKMLKIFFIVHQKLIKENQNQRLEKVLQGE